MASLTFSAAADDKTIEPQPVKPAVMSVKDKLPLRIEMELGTPAYATFRSHAEMKEYFLKNLRAANPGAYGNDTQPSTGVEIAPEGRNSDEKGSFSGAADAPAVAEADSAAGSNAGEYGQTNNQVAGVNEADIIKNDGKYIYVISQNTGTLSIIDADVSKGMKAVASIPLQRESSYYNNMFVYGDKLVLLFNEYRYVTYDKNFSPVSDSVNTKIARPGGIYGYSENYSGMDIYDITDRSSPKLERTVKAQGNLIDSREQGGVVYLITNQWSSYYWIYGAAENDLAKIPENVYIPTYYDSLQGKDAILVPAENVAYFKDGGAENARTFITAVDLETGEAPAINSFLSNSWGSVFMSTDAVYITGSEWKDDTTYTNIVKYSVDGTNLQYVATGRVEGNMLNQFSADQHDGYFRIATTEWQKGNHVWVFDSKMTMVSALRGLAKGESIQSARFMGDRLYLVTFLRIDPLFVIDLSDVHSPKVLGELKIPGFSTYLHPVGNGLVVGIGMGSATMYYRDDDTGEEVECGTTETGVKASLFDVSDPSNPREIAKLRLGQRGSYSESLYNHKSFLNISSREMFAIRGEFVTALDENGFSSKYESKAVLVSYADGALKVVKSFAGDYSWDTANRMTYINNVLYHFTGNDIVAYDMDANYKKLGSVKYNNYVEQVYDAKPMSEPATDSVAKPKTEIIPIGDIAVAG